MIGPVSQRRRCASSASAKAIAKPIASETTRRGRCARAAATSTCPRLSAIQSGQKPFVATQSVPVRSRIWTWASVSGVMRQHVTCRRDFGGRDLERVGDEVEREDADDAAVGVDDRRVPGLLGEQVAERVAQDVVDVDDRLGAASAARPGRARRSARARDSQPCGRPWSSTSSGMSMSASAIRARTSETSSPALTSGAFHRSTSRDALQRQALERAVGADEVLDELVGRAHQQLGGRGVLREVAALLAAPRSCRPS